MKTALRSVLIVACLAPVVWFADGCAGVQPTGGASAAGGCARCACATYSPGQGPNCACGHPHPAGGGGGVR